MNDPIPTPVLDAIGGEPLDGSGFEAELSDDTFELSEASNGDE